MNIILTILLAILTGAIIYLIVQNRKKAAPQDAQSFLMLQNQLDALNKTLDAKLQQTHDSVAKQFGESTRLIQHISSDSQRIIEQVTAKMTHLDETNKQVLNFSAQLESLEKILTNPKQRGILGEYFLETLLKNVLPPAAYEMQYKFKDGEIVDAVVFVGEKIIPIDSKFSLENYNRIVQEQNETERERLENVFKQDLKKRIDETSKYIRPGEGTMDFSIMFLPSEGIFYDILINQIGAVKLNTRDLIEYAFSKHVVIVSPTSFFAYLQTILQGLRALQIEESAKEIRANVEKLQKHIIAYGDFMMKLGGHLGTTVNAYNHASKELKKIDTDLFRITGAESDMPVNYIDKPAEE